MNIYKLTQNVNTGYDTYDALVVYAKSAERAREIMPYEVDEKDTYNLWVSSADKDKIKVEYLGKARSNAKEGIIVSSFVAG
jgi:hypothetical protein